MFNYIFSILYIFIIFCSCCFAPLGVRKFVFETVQRLMTFLFMQNEGGLNVLLSLCRERWSTGWPVRCTQPVGKDPLPQWVKGWWKETVSPSPGSFAPPNSGQSQSAVMFPNNVRIRKHLANYGNYLLHIEGSWNYFLTLHLCKNEFVSSAVIMRCL